MADSQHAQPFAGEDDEFPENQRELENELSAKNNKTKNLSKMERLIVGHFM